MPLSDKEIIELANMGKAHNLVVSQLAEEVIGSRQKLKATSEYLIKILEGDYEEGSLLYDLSNEAKKLLVILQN